MPINTSVPIMYIFNLDECVMEHDLVDVPAEWLFLLDKALAMLKDEAKFNDNASISNAIEIGDDLKERLRAISCGQFHTDIHIDHITI